MLQVHRLVIVDEEDHVVGILSLSDILNHLVLKPMGKGRTKCIAKLKQFVMLVCFVVVKIQMFCSKRHCVMLMYL